jgi:hypothetical protein
MVNLSVWLYVSFTLSALARNATLDDRIWMVELLPSGFVT